MAKEIYILFKKYLWHLVGRSPPLWWVLSVTDGAAFNLLDIHPCDSASVSSGIQEARLLGQKAHAFKILLGTSLAIQWLGLCSFTAKGSDSIPGRETKIPQAMGPIG